MSFGATALITACARCAGSSAISSSRAVSSSAARMRVPFRGPSSTSAGLDPNMAGELATAAPLAIVKWSETWCPSTRQPHLPLADGVPNTEKK